MNLNVDSWKEFRLGDLFSEMYKAEAHVKGELECYDVPLGMTAPYLRQQIQRERSFLFCWSFKCLLHSAENIGNHFN